MNHIDVSKWVNSPDQLICILWEVDNSSGMTMCEAGRGQHEIDRLCSAGYKVINIVPA